MKANNNVLRAVCPSFAAALLALLSSVPASAQSRATLDVSETVFSVVAAINVCGYDQELQSSSPVRAEVRRELMEASRSGAAAEAAREMCRFYERQALPKQAQELSHYISLGLNLGPPPEFQPRFADADLPPDAAYVSGILPLLQRYYVAAHLHSIWQKHQPEYEALIDQNHVALAQMIHSTDNYVRMPLSGFEGRSFTVYVDPMVAPSEVNSRNYEDAYYVVVSPASGDLHIDALRHTYLHFVLDPLIRRRATVLERLTPLLYSVEQAPMPEQYKRDIGLLAVECLIRAIEIRNPSDTKLSENERLALVKKSEEQGYVLTSYFYDQLREFEKSDTGLQTVFPDWLRNIDVQHENKRAANIIFSAEASPDVMQSPEPRQPNSPQQNKVDIAERALAAGNSAEAGRLAQQSLQAGEDPSRAYFGLAKVASLNGQMQEAQSHFAKALKGATDPHVIAWSHIYLGRILDIQEERDSALAQYKLALATSAIPADAKDAAERGLQEPYRPAKAKHNEE